MRCLAVFLCLSLFSCVHRIDFGPTGQIDDPHQILEVLGDRYERLRTLRAEGRMGIEAPQGSGSLRFALDLAKPGALFLETADVLGIARGTFASDGETFGFYDPGEHVFYEGPAHPEILGRFLPIALPPDEIVSLLLGQPDLLWDGEARMKVEEDGFYLLELVEGRVRQRVRVATRDLRLVSVQTQGRPAVDVELSDHERVAADLPFPTRIELRERRSGTTIRLRYRDHVLDAPLDPAIFRMEPPPGARIVRVDS